MIQKGLKQDAIINVVNDFSNINKSKTNTVYEVHELEESNNLFCFMITKRDKVWPQPHDTIGAVSKYFPTKFKEINKNLFVWNDSTSILSKELISKLQNYKAIDSTVYKIKTGKLDDSNWPIVKSDDSKKAVFYFICKENISKLYKQNLNTIKSPENYPKVDCGDKK